MKNETSSGSSEERGYTFKITKRRSPWSNEVFLFNLLGR